MLVLMIFQRLKPYSLEDRETCSSLIQEKMGVKLVLYILTLKTSSWDSIISSWKMPFI